MAEQLYTMANTRIFIGENPVAAKTNVTPEDFDNVNWIEIRGLYNLGELGGDQTINEFELISEEWMQKTKGTRNGGTMTNQFIPMALDPGQMKFRDAIEDNCNPYPFRIERGADCSPEATVTIAEGAPGVVTWAGNDFMAGQPVMFTPGDDGVMPGGLTEGVVYFVVGDGLSGDAFSVAATAGGDPIEVTTASEGEIIATAPPAGMTDYFQGLAIDGARSGGGKNDLYTRTWGIAVNGRVITV